jgi:hypothetical protein
LAAKTTFRLVTGVARTLATTTAVIGIGLFGFSGSASSQTVTPGSTDQVQHFLDCFGVMINDPQVHAAECSPGHEWTGPFQYATNYQAGQSASTTEESSCPPLDTVEDGSSVEVFGDLDSEGGCPPDNSNDDDSPE